MKLTPNTTFLTSARHKRDLLRATGGKGIHGDGDGGIEGSDRAQRRVLRVV